MSLNKSKQMLYLLIQEISKKFKNKSLFLQISNIRKRYPYTFSSYREGSYTIEAAVVLPLVLVFGMLILFCMKTVYTQWKVSTVLDQVVNTAALYGEPVDDAWLYGAFYAMAAKEDVPTEDIFGGLAGITLFQSTVDDLRISLSADYIITYPIEILGKQGFYVSQRRTARIWNGYDPNQANSDALIAYVTKYGTVYHLSLSCPHIDLSIRSVSKEKLANARNSSGGTYKKCPMCGEKSETYYVTSWGDCYHSRLSCSGLKRTIYQLSLEEAKESYRACQKCAVEN